MNSYESILKLFVFLTGIIYVNAQGFYKAVAPRVVRPNSEFHVAISTYGTSVPTTVSAVLEGTTKNGSIYTFDDTISVSPYTSRICRLDVGDISDGDYKLILSGRGGIDFVSDYPLKFVNKSYSVFIQTDKAVYKPGTKILFRAIVLNSQLKPAAEVRDEPLHIFITDGNGNQVKQWRRVQAIKGVFSGELQLSNSPVLGNWNISVTIHGQTFSKSLEVASYILPKFIVAIEAPKHITFEENIITATIRTRYASGKQLKGEAVITAFPTYSSGVIQPIFQNPVRKVAPIDGSTIVQFDIAKELQLNDEYERAVVLDVVVEEALTGRRQNNSVVVLVHKYNYRIDLIKTADYFKPGLAYVAYAKVTNHDGSPLNKDQNEIKVRHGYSRQDEVYAVEKHRLDKNGLVKLTYYTPSEATNTTALRIEASYLNLKERISPIPAAVSFSSNFLQVSLETDRPIVNLDVEVLVNCTEPLNYINYVLVGRGDVLIANTLQVYNKKEYRFHFTATHAMVPLSHLIVSYIRPDGELIGDTLDIEIDGLFQNFLDIQVNPAETEPEFDVDFTIRAQPNSYIGLLAVDEKAVNLRRGFDLTPNDVINELDSYDMSIQSPYATITRGSKYQYMWKPGASNLHSGIYSSGADLLTNTHVNRYQPTLEDIYLRPIFYGSSTVKPDRGFGLPLYSVTRPPLAGPYAFSRIPRPVWNKPKVYLTENLADTWLFNNFSSGYEGKTSIRKKVPSTLTTWVISGFSLDPLHGLGVITAPKQIKVAKSFSVNLDLPFSIQKGEILAVPVVVHNNLKQDIVADVTIHNPEQKFEFYDGPGNSTKKIELYKRKKLKITRNSAGSVSFMIRAIQVGPIEIKATANSPMNQDVTTKILTVTVGGETEYYTKTVLVDLRKTKNFMKSINFTIPKYVIEDSERIEVSTVGDLLGPTMVNLEHLIRLPTGCGEQNLVHIMPSVTVLQYLKNTQQFTPAIENEAIGLLERAYQQQLAYKHEDGSFGVFGFNNETTSVWLTAYVALALRQAKNFIYVDENIIKGCLDWLEKKQGYNGSFVEIGPVIHQDLQGRDGNSLALTAFSLLAFIENQRYYPSFTNTINKGMDYIARNIDNQESTYSLALCSYMLQLSRHPSKQGVFNLLDARSKSNENMRWWAKDTDNEKKNPWNSLPRSVDIETTSYALLALLEGGFVEDSLPVLNWLVDQQNSIGGFASSHDTAIGLYAINKLINKLSSPINMQIDFTYRRQETNRFQINKNNAMIFQKFLLRKDARIVNITAQGTGLALFRVSYQYNVNTTGPWPMFTLDPQVDKISTKHHIQISICSSFVARNLTESIESNMAVMEVNFPSGFTADIDALPSLEVSQNVQKVETANDFTKVILYFNNLTSQFESCPTVSAFKTHQVADQRMVPVVIYDYYDSSRRARLFYRGMTSTACDICEGDNCNDICAATAATAIASESREGSDKDGASNIDIAQYILFVAIMTTVLQRLTFN